MECTTKNRIFPTQICLAGLLVLGNFLLFSPVFSSSGPGTSGMSFVGLMSSVRSSGMANASTGLGSMDSVLNNPAGFANQRAPAIQFQLMNYVDSGRLYQIVIAYPFGFGVVGGDFGVLDYGQQLRTTFSDRTGSSGDSFGTSSQKLGLSYAVKLDPFTFGATVTQLKQVLDSDELSAWGVDVGSTLLISPSLTMGASITQLTFKGQQSGSETRALPSSGHLGLCWTQNDWSWPTTISSDVVIPSDEPMYVQSGVETEINPSLLLRMGLTTRPVFSQFSSGLGIKIGDVAVDFSYHPSSALGDFYRIGVGFKW